MDVTKGRRIFHQERPIIRRGDLSLCQKRVCDLEGKQWRIDGHESGSAYCEQSIKSASPGCNPLGILFCFFDRLQQWSNLFLFLFFLRSFLELEAPMISAHSFALDLLVCMHPARVVTTPGTVAVDSLVGPIACLVTGTHRWWSEAGTSTRRGTEEGGGAVRPGVRERCVRGVRLETDLTKMSGIVRVGDTGKLELEGMHWTGMQAGTWKRGNSREEGLSQRTSFVNLRVLNTADYEAPTKALEKLVEDCRSLTSTETTHVGRTRHVCIGTSRHFATKASH